MFDLKVKCNLLNSCSGIKHVGAVTDILPKMCLNVLQQQRLPHIDGYAIRADYILWTIHRGVYLCNSRYVWSKDFSLPFPCWINRNWTFRECGGLETRLREGFTKKMRKSVVFFYS